MPAPPDHLSVSAILGAKVDELHYWIETANKDYQAHAGLKKKPLTKAGKHSDLQKKLAGFYGLDLCLASGPDAPIQEEAPLNNIVDKEIQCRQWAYLRDLGQEWETSVSSGVPFQLCICKSGELLLGQWPFDVKAF